MKFITVALRQLLLLLNDSERDVIKRWNAVPTGPVRKRTVDKKRVMERCKSSF
jgi:hypothetical protein